MNIYFSNRLEYLILELAKKISMKTSDPFKPDTVIVQSNGMKQWVSMRLAEVLEVSANIDYRFPNEYLHSVINEKYPDFKLENHFDIEILKFHIMKILPEFLEKKEFEIIRNYIRSGNEELKLFQLSEKIAHTFDQYLLYRGKMIEKWTGEEFKSDDWQPILFRELVRRLGENHRSRYYTEFMKGAGSDKNIFEDDGSEINIIGISYLPPVFLRLFKALSEVRKVNLFLLNPCKEYWGDLRKKDLIDGDDDYKANSLLVSLGKLGKDFFDEFVELEENPEEYYFSNEVINAKESRENTLLQKIQDDILRLKNNEKEKIRKGDRSIQIHSCHSIKREVEVLHDAILEKFRNNSELKPEEIIVMAPDIEKYAPFVEAVFSVVNKDEIRIPYSISDKSSRSEFQLSEYFRKILDTLISRFSNADIINLLESVHIRKKFNMGSRDIDVIRFWIREMRIKWGIDASHKKEFDLPEFKENTWEEAFRKLILSMSMEADGYRLFQECSPSLEISGSEAQILGNLIDLIEKLRKTAEKIKKKHTISKWCIILKEILDDFFHIGHKDDREYQMILDEINKLAKNSEFAQFEEKLSFEILRDLINESLKETGSGFGFLVGGITFCSMRPMRSIPFKMIAYLGLNNIDFPGEDRKTGFNHIEQHPKKGDRTKRDDNRYLFLETLICARENIFISFTGMNPRDNKENVPSIVVSELIDYINDNYECEFNESGRFEIIRHKLQPFNPAYFRDDEELFSYSANNEKIAKSIFKGEFFSELFFRDELPEIEDEFQNIELSDFMDFFINPCRFLLCNRMGINLSDDIEELDEDEAFELSGLDAFEIKNIIAENSQDDEKLEFVKNQSMLPHGKRGEILLEELDKSLDKYRSFLDEKKCDDEYEETVSVEAGSVRISGELKISSSVSNFFSRPAKIKAKDLLRGFIYHLFYNSVKSDEEKETEILGIDGDGNPDLRIFEVKRCRETLKEYVSLYLMGLKTPLCFFPEASLAYSEKKFKPKSSRGKPPLLQAEDKYNGDYGEGKDPWIKYCFDRAVKFDSDFEKICTVIYLPLLDCMRRWEER